MENELKIKAAPSRFLFIISSLDFGGAQRVVMMIANHLVHQGYQVGILTLSKDEKPAFELDSRIELIPLNQLEAATSVFESIRNNFLRLLSLRKSIQSFSPDRIISFMDKMNILVLMATLGLKIRVTVSERSHPRLNLRSYFLRILRTLIYKRADRIVFQTEGARGQIQGLDHKKVMIIPNPVELTEGRAAMGETRDSIRVVGLGRLSFEKGFDLLIRAFAALQNEFPKATLTIYGDGPEREALSRLAASLNARVELPGWRDSRLALSGADVFVLPSRYEGFPNALLEAMALGVPSIAADCEFGPREIIGDSNGAMLFKSESVEELGRSLRSVLTSERNRQEISERALAQVKRFDSRVVLQKWNDAIGLGPTRAVFLIRSLNVGGAERQLVNLLNGLDPLRVHSTLLTFYPEGALQSELAPHVQLMSLDKKGRWSNLIFIWKLWRRLRELRPSVVYSFLTTANLFMAIVRIFDHSFRLIWGVRASTMNLNEFGLVARLEAKVEDVLKFVPDLIILNSKAARDLRARKGYSSDKMLVIPNGIDVDRFRIDSQERDGFRAKAGVSEGDVLIGSLGRFDPMKGFEIFLAAASKALQFNSSLKFAIMGTGDANYESKLKALAKDLGLEEKVIWMRGLDSRTFYNGIDLFTLSSLGEGFPNVLAEAMSCGKFCVATDVGDAKEILSSFGILIRPGDAQGLAQAWMEALQSKSRWDSREISDSIRNRFVVGRLAEETCRVLQQLN